MAPLTLEPLYVECEVAAMLWNVGTTKFAELVKRKIIHKAIPIDGRRVLVLPKLQQEAREYYERHTASEDAVAEMDRRLGIAR